MAKLLHSWGEKSIREKGKRGGTKIGVDGKIPQDEET